jgi:hypothetical protein
MAGRRRPKSERASENRPDSVPPVNPQQKESEQGSGKSWITDSAIIIALATVTSYLFHIFYEVGFYGYFSIPDYFISPSKTQVLIIAGQVTRIVGFLLIPSLLVKGSYPYIRNINRRFPVKERTGYVTRKIFPVAYIIVVGVLGYLFFPKWWPVLLDDLSVAKEPIFRLCAVITLAVLSIPWLSNRIRLFVLFFILVVTVPGSRQLGQYEAERWVPFLVVKQPPDVPTVSEAVGLRIYGEYLLAVPFNRENKEFKKTLLLLKMSEIAKNPLTFEQVGPLKPKE